MKLLIEVTLDGYDDERELYNATIDFVRSQLASTTSGVRILWNEGQDKCL